MRRAVALKNHRLAPYRLEFFCPVERPMAMSKPDLTRGNSADSIVELSDIHLKLDSAAGPVNILRGIDLAVGRGETVSVVGPSGSGKSTMMMIMAGLERPSRGSVRIAGHDLGTMNEDALARFRRDHVGIVFQNFHLVPTMTALENVAIPLEFAGRADAFDRAAANLGAVGLGHRLTHYPGQLSGGEQQRVALARAFTAEPSLLLADEPTGNLDGETGSHIIRLMFDLARGNGTTLVLITHDPALAARCDRAVRMLDGRITADGAPRASDSAEAVRAAGE
jgi:putative ABC transport system ATP-binding protein